MERGPRKSATLWQPSVWRFASITHLRLSPTERATLPFFQNDALPTAPTGARRKEKAPRGFTSRRCFLTSLSSLLGGVVVLAAIYCDVGLFALRHHHVEAAIDATFWIGCGEADPVNTSVALTRPFSAE